MAYFVTYDEMAKKVSGVLKQTPDQLGTYWPQILKDSQQAAHGEIRRRLSNRGYSASQIASWDDGIEFESSITIFWALMHGGALHNYDDTFIKVFDRREELDDVQVLVGGVAVDPDDPSEGNQVAWGMQAATRERFNQDFEADARIGETTKW